MLKLNFGGAINTVTGSRTFVKYGTHQYLVDCGLFQGPREIREKNWKPISNAENIHALILTHAHIDHSGLIPLLVRSGFRGPIYCSPATAELCNILLPDAGRLQEEDAHFANVKGYSHHNPALPLFTEREAIESLKFFSPIKSNEWLGLEKGLRLRLLRSGHILGSTFVQLSHESAVGTKILTFSGDVGRPNPLLLREPFQIGETDDLIIESTYGDRVHSRENVNDQLALVINKVLTRGGTLLIPAFSVGRTQDLLYMIRKLEADNKIGSHKIFVDSPMAINTSDLYSKYSDEIKPELVGNVFQSAFRNNIYHSVRSVDDSMLLCMDSSPKIVISASGMLHGGRILHHLKAKLPDARSGVLFVAYQPPGTKGHLLKQGLGNIRIHHQEISVEAEVFSIDGLSAHADSNELVNWLRSFRRKPDRVFINHGEESARCCLKYRLQHELGLKVTLPNENEDLIVD